MARQPFIWGALCVIDRMMNALPHPAAVRSGAAIGSAAGLFSRARARKAEDRVTRALGATDAEARRIVKGVYRNFGSTAVEMMRMPQMGGRLEELISVTGEEHLRAAYERGRGVVIMSAHIGNWEYGAALLARRGYKMNAIIAEQRDDRITALTVAKRDAVGVRSISKERGMRGVISCLRAGEVLAVLLDQDAKEAGVVSDFLGMPASTPIAVIKLAQRCGSAVLPISAIRREDGVSFDMTIEPPLDCATDDQSMADACNEAIGRWVRRHPEQWMWVYPRWASTTGDR